MKVLILEDDPFIALDLQSIVESDGHEVVGSFDSVADASEHLGDHFDYALLDIDVADGRSYGIAAELMKRRIPFAFVSASRPSEIPQYLKAASFIAKPFEETVVLRTLERSAQA